MLEEPQYTDSCDVPEDNEQPEPDVSEYAHFDKSTCQMLEMNHGIFQAQAKAAQMRKPVPVTFRFDVTTHMSDLNNLQNNSDGAVTTVNILNAARAAVCQSKGFHKLVHEKDGIETTLPSGTCYVSDLRIDDATNTTGVDLALTCNQKERCLGAYCKGTLAGNESCSFDEEETPLYVLHAGTQFHSDQGRQVHKMKDRHIENRFAKYSDAITHDIEKCITPIKGGDQIEYVSPHCLMIEDQQQEVRMFEDKGDWWSDIAYMNPHQLNKGITHSLHEINESEITCKKLKARLDKMKEQFPDMTAKKISYRCHKTDHDKIMDGIRDAVIEPLKNMLIPIKEKPTLEFKLTPVVQTSNVDDDRNGANKWKAYLETNKGKTDSGRATISARCTLRFVGSQ